MKKGIWLGLVILVVAFLLGSLLSCTSSDEDDDEELDNPYAPDDDDDDDDTVQREMDCTEAYTYFFQTCGFTFVDNDGFSLSFSDLMAMCDVGNGSDCIIACYKKHGTDCQKAQNCTKGCTS